jgi:hypothetical protein
VAQSLASGFGAPPSVEASAASSLMPLPPLVSSTVMTIAGAATYSPSGGNCGNVRGLPC